MSSAIPDAPEPRIRAVPDSRLPVKVLGDILKVFWAVPVVYEGIGENLTGK